MIQPAAALLCFSFPAMFMLLLQAFRGKTGACLLKYSYKSKGSICITKVKLFAMAFIYSSLHDI